MQHANGRRRFDAAAIIIIIIIITAAAATAAASTRQILQGETEGSFDGIEVRDTGHGGKK